MKYHKDTGAFTKSYALRRIEKGKWRNRPRLIDAVVQMMHDTHTESIVDFGAGVGISVGLLKEQGVKVAGFDGIDDVESISKGAVKQADLSLPQDFGEKWDWVMSIDVGEHIPPDRCAIFIENIVRHAAFGIVLTWALPGTPGAGHCNCLDANLIREYFLHFDFYRNDELTVQLSATVHRNIKKALQVFTKEKVLT